MSVRYQEAKSAYETAKSEYERKEELAREKLVTESDFRKAKNEYETAAANYGNLKRNFASGRHSEGSPMSTLAIVRITSPKGSLATFSVENSTFQLCSFGKTMPLLLLAAASAASWCASCSSS